MSVSVEKRRERALSPRLRHTVVEHQLTAHLEALQNTGIHTDFDTVRYTPAQACIHTLKHAH